MNWNEASKSSTGYILIRKNLTPMMRLMVLWTTYGLCSFCRSSFSSVINFFFTAGNLREKKKTQIRFYIKTFLHCTVRRVLNQHFHKKSSSSRSRDAERIWWQYSGSTPPKISSPRLILKKCGLRVCARRWTPHPAPDPSPKLNQRWDSSAGLNLEDNSSWELIS